MEKKRIRFGDELPCANSHAQERVRAVSVADCQHARLEWVAEAFKN